jgi:hypothetical protein
MHAHLTSSPTNSSQTPSESRDVVNARSKDSILPPINILNRLIDMTNGDVFSKQQADNLTLALTLTLILILTLNRWIISTLVIAPPVEKRVCRLSTSG